MQKWSHKISTRNWVLSQKYCIPLRNFVSLAKVLHSPWETLCFSGKGIVFLRETLHSLAKHLHLLKQHFVRSQNICVFSQKYCIHEKLWGRLQKKLRSLTKHLRSLTKWVHSLEELWKKRSSPEKLSIISQNLNLQAVILWENANAL